MNLPHKKNTELWKPGEKQAEMNALIPVELIVQCRGYCFNRSVSKQPNRNCSTILQWWNNQDSVTNRSHLALFWLGGRSFAIDVWTRLVQRINFPSRLAPSGPGRHAPSFKDWWNSSVALANSRRKDWHPIQILASWLIWKKRNSGHLWQEGESGIGRLRQNYFWAEYLVSCWSSWCSVVQTTLNTARL